MYPRQVDREGVGGQDRKEKLTSLTLSFLPSFHSSGLESSLLETALLLNIHGTQDLERIVPPVPANDL